MKKLKLRLLEFGALEVLNKDQLRLIYGGDQSGGSGHSVNACAYMAGNPDADPIPCSVHYMGQNFTGVCGMINGTCKCDTEIGDYDDASGFYCDQPNW